MRSHNRYMTNRGGFLRIGSGGIGGYASRDASQDRFHSNGAMNKNFNMEQLKRRLP